MQRSQERDLRGKSDFRKEMVEGRSTLKKDRAEFNSENDEFVVERDQLKNGEGLIERGVGTWWLYVGLFAHQ